MKFICLKKGFIFLSFCIGLTSISSHAREVEFNSPDGLLKVIIEDTKGKPNYSIQYDGDTFVKKSPIGLITDLGDFTKNLRISQVSTPVKVSGEYQMRNTKKSDIQFEGNQGSVTFANDTADIFTMEWHLQNNDVAFRYIIIPHGETRVCRVLEETTEFILPEGSTTFLSPQMDAMGGWMRTAPSYETYYTGDLPMSESRKAENGFVLPALFKIGDKGWLQISETGVGSNYSAMHLGYNGDGSYQLIFPDEKEFNGNGTSQPGLYLPGYTPWRTITLGKNLAPLAETTIQFDLVEPLYAPSKEFQYGKGTWSWIIYDDGATIMPVQKDYVDFSHELGYQTVLVDGRWDTQIGRDSIAALAKDAAEKDVALFLWYNSNGYWNDAPQTPRGIMDNTIKRRKEMQWMKDNGIRGIKVDFIGSDKQQAMKLYEDILADANDYGLMVIFHGSTLPRGWEKMYPNFVAAESVRASENLRFLQHENDREAYSATFLPVSRNAVASMDFGGSTLNRYYNPEDKPGASQRRTSDVFSLATAVMYQSPVQHFALARSGVANAPDWAVDFMKTVPTTWEDIIWIDGYPGKNAALARLHDHTWYVVGINAEDSDFNFTIPEKLLSNAKTVTVYSDSKNLNGSKQEYVKNKLPKISIPKNGGYVAVIPQL